MTYRLPALNTLRAFEAAARHLSFKTAADELGVTAGAVSQQVKNLEASLAVVLFRRLAHGLLLTREGEAYYPNISTLF
ncbi:MAG: LysR family transcriptional regulator [Pseudomonadota bacterium]